IRVRPFASGPAASVWAASPTTPLDPRAAAIAARLRQPFSKRWAMHPRFALAVPPTADQVAALAQLHARAGTPVEVTLRPSTGTPRRIKAPALERAAIGSAGPASDEHTARAFLRSNRRLLRIEDPDTELVLQRHDADALGRRHLRFAHRYRGLPVWPSELIVHLDRGGNVDLMNGAFVPTPRLSSIQPVVDAATAVERAEAVVPGGRSAFVTGPSLIVHAPGDKPTRLAWRLELRPSLVSHWLVVVDAETGVVLTAYDQVMDANVAGSGVDVLGVTRPLNVFQDGATFFLLDTSKPMFDPTSGPPPAASTRGAIFILDAANLPATSNPQTIPPVSQITSTSPSAGFLPDGVSAAFNFSETFDYFFQRHGRNSLDGQGGSIRAIVRYGQGLANAYFIGEQQLMLFGDALPFAAALDVVAHELTHGVTAHSANLIYVDQPGALNEAMSDIFGELVEARTFGGADWRTGSVLGGGLRDLKDPSSREIIPGLGRRYPARMSELIAPTDPFLNNFVGRDNGGVHFNSTIISHAFYLLAEGLPGAVGLDAASRIFYRALTVHLVANSQFIDARLACVQSAEELFGVGSPQALRTAEAFSAVEIAAGPGTPVPTPRPSVSGADATLFAFFDADAQSFFLGRREGADPPQGIQLSEFDVLLSRPSVTSDGATAAFVDGVNDVCLIATDNTTTEGCFGLPGTVHSVAMSRDGTRLSFVLLDGAGNPDNRITVIDTSGGGTDRTFTLVAPTLDGDGATVDAVLYADAMTFTADGRFLLYDALNEIRLVDGSSVQVWSIYALELSTGQVLALVPPVPGLDIGFPSLSHTRDDLITFDALDSVTRQSRIFTGDLTTGDRVLVATSIGGYGVPSFTGDDSGIVYTQDDVTATAASLFLQPLAADRLRPVGGSSLWLRDATSGVIYRRGVAASTAAVTLSGTAFRAGQTLTVGVSLQNPPSGQTAELYVGAIMPDGRTVLFFSAPGVLGGAGLLSTPASFQAMQVAEPGFTLSLPAFFSFTFPAAGVPAGTYQFFAALVRQGALLDNRLDIGDFLGLDIRAFTFTP
ncbi:MAG TPA: M4 family metallopeptidase, partial [Candidatus Limnocylindrales bacterium]|nr:M4 family metallopeptidase [Candidatus Limnocylindrales bacterium]